STFHITLLTVKQYKEMRVVDQVNIVNTFTSNILESSSNKDSEAVDEKEKSDTSPPLKDSKEGNKNDSPIEIPPNKWNLSSSLKEKPYTFPPNLPAPKNLRGIGAD